MERIPGEYRGGRAGDRPSVLIGEELNISSGSGVGKDEQKFVLFRRYPAHLMMGGAQVFSGKQVSVVTERLGGVAPGPCMTSGLP